MAKLIKANKLLLIVFVLIFALCFTMVMITVSQTSAKAATWTEEGNVTIGHLTDTHYYPFRLCYTGNVTTSGNDDFFYNYIMAKSTKMWLEAENIFDVSLQAFADNPPDYIVLSGDIGQDGELLSHVDVANKLRVLQNTVRAAQGNDKFQIFVVLGNHDLYNEDTFRFDNINGLKVVDLYTARMDATKIYAGLGYPNMTDAEANEYYADMAADLPSGYTYVRSNLSSDFTYTWQFLKKDNGNTITYDMSVENADDITMAKLLDANLVKTIDNSSYFSSSDMSYTYNNDNGGIDLALGEMTFIAARHDDKYTCVGLDVVISNARDGHVLGGQVQNTTQVWLEENKTFLKPAENTVINGISHHSLIPHWKYEEEITTGFIIYNWQEVTDYLADLGMRYVFTGHMHSNSTVSRVSFNGNQITDFESASNVSVESQIKITKIRYGSFGTSYAEKAMLSAYNNVSVPAIDLFDNVYANDKYGYVAKNKLGEFLNYNTKHITDYSKYAKRRIYDNAVENTLGSFLKPTITEKVGDLVANIKFSLGFMSIDLGSYANDVVKLADNLIKQISLVILEDYTYKGDNPLFKIEENKVFGFLEDMIYGLLQTKIAGDTGIFEVFMYCYMGHNTGEDVATVNDMPKAYVAVLNEVKNGNFVKFLVNSLLDDETGLMKLIEGLCTTTLDVSEGISSGFKSLVSSAGSVLGFGEKTFKLELDKFNLGAILKVLGTNVLVTGLIEKTGFHIDLVNYTLPEIIYDLINKYITDSFTQSLGEYAYNILTAFGSDGGHLDPHDDNNGNGYLVTIYSGEEFTYVKQAREEVISLENGKLPSMLTTNFGSDPATSQSFTYFTDRRVSDGAIQYVKVNEDGTYNKNAATTKTATTQVYGTTKPLIDLGIWAQSGYVELSRHTIDLTTLTASTTYAYRVGSASKGYWSDWYQFTTAPADDKGSFDALITSDLQSSTESAYQRIDTLYRSILESKIFDNGISFLINPGDATDNSRNLSQFKWFINSSPDIYASYSTVIANGNHDEKYFSLDKASNVEYYGGVSANAYTDEYNYLQFHYNYPLTAQQKQLTGFYYSFDYSGVHFTVINSSDIEDNKLHSTQYQWLVNDLKNTTKQHKVIIMHKSLYSEGSHSYDKDVVGMRAQLTPLFAENGVSLVIAGHDHTYTETFYLDANGKKILTNANGKNEISGKGTLYLTMGTFGEKFYNRIENPLVKSNTGWNLHKDGKLADPVFGKLSFDGEKLYYYGYQYLRTYNEDGSLKGGEIVEIKKSMDWTTLISAGLLGVTILSMIIAIIVTAAKKRR